MRRSGSRKHVIAVLLAGAGIQLVVLQAFGVFGGGSPTEFAPSPMPLAFLYFAGLGPLAFGIPVVAFWFWGLPLFRGASAFPVRSLGLTAVALASSVTWLALGGASRYYTWPFFAVSGGFVLLGAVAIVSCRNRPSFVANVLGHALLFAWIGSFAFPWLGEVP